MGSGSGKTTEAMKFGNVIYGLGKPTQLPFTVPRFPFGAAYRLPDVLINGSGGKSEQSKEEARSVL